MKEKDSINIVIDSEIKTMAKDLKRASKRGKNIDKLETVINLLQAQETLEIRYRNHQLVGNWFPCWECHIEPDWLLIYEPT